MTKVLDAKEHYEMKTLTKYQFKDIASANITGGVFDLPCLWLLQAFFVKCWPKTSIRAFKPIKCHATQTAAFICILSAFVCFSPSLHSGAHSSAFIENKQMQNLHKMDSDQVSCPRTFDIFIEHILCSAIILICSWSAYRCIQILREEAPGLKCFCVCLQKAFK